MAAYQEGCGDGEAVGHKGAGRIHLLVHHVQLQLPTKKDPVFDKDQASFEVGYAWLNCNEVFCSKELARGGRGTYRVEEAVDRVLGCSHSRH